VIDAAAARLRGARKTSADHASRALSRSVALPAWGAAIAAAELVALTLGRLSGALMHAALVAVLSNVYLVLRRRLGEADSTQRAADELHARTTAILTLVPLLRLLALSLPVATVSAPYQYALVGAPMAVAAFLTMRMLGRARPPVWAPPLPRSQLLLVASGVPLGLLGFLILRPAPLVGSWSLQKLAVATLILFAFTGFLEELIFRGLLQRVWSQASGSSGVLWSTAVFAISYCGTRSPGFVVFIGAVGLLFGVSYQRTGSLLGVSAAHGCFSAGLLLFWPLILGQGT